MCQNSRTPLQANVWQLPRERAFKRDQEGGRERAEREREREGGKEREIEERGKESEREGERERAERVAVMVPFHYAFQSRLRSPM